MYKLGAVLENVQLTISWDVIRDYQKAMKIGYMRSSDGGVSGSRSRAIASLLIRTLQLA
jgi:hypothetical protein